MTSKKLKVALLLGVLLFMSGAWAEQYIAGVNPSSRPEAAPVITQYAKDAAWYEEALRGVERPYPASLQFLEDQGAWYTPFNRPGMPGVYDIRNLH